MPMMSPGAPGVIRGRYLIDAMKHISSLQLTPEQIEAFAEYKASYLPEEISANSAFRRAIASHANELLDLAKPEVCAARKLGTKSYLAEEEFRERVLIEDGARVA